jgi:hypothetical protein
MEMASERDRESAHELVRNYLRDDANGILPRRDFLVHEGDHNCMIYIVVRRVAGSDILECQLGDKAYDTWKPLLQGSVRAVVQ